MSRPMISWDSLAYTIFKSAMFSHSSTFRFCCLVSKCGLSLRLRILFTPSIIESVFIYCGVLFILYRQLVLTLNLFGFLLFFFHFFLFTFRFKHIPLYIVLSFLFFDSCLELSITISTDIITISNQSIKFIKGLKKVIGHIKLIVCPAHKFRWQPRSET